MDKIVFLAISYVPHQLTSIRSIIDKYNMEIHSFSVSKDYTYIPLDVKGLHTYKQTDFTKEELLSKVLELNPKMVVVAGWMIPEYVWVTKKIMKKLDIPIAAMSDTPWHGTFRQRINALISPFHLKKAYTHLWVAGIRQYDYARRLGFRNDQIIFHSLSANVNLFKQVDINQKNIDYPRNFVYIGRFVEVKGLDILQKAWNNISDKREWTLTLIGDGKLRNEFEKDKSICIKNAMSQEELLQELQTSGCFILPSIREPWALVIHEAVAAGLPIICTETCGASPHFVINKFNGQKVEVGSVGELQKAMETIMDLDVDTLIKYSNNSRILSNTISPELTAASLMQLI